MSTHAAPLEAILAPHSTGDLPFVKMHGTGNDFVALDAISHPLCAAFDFAHAAQTLCDRNRGVGGDGILLLDAPEEWARKQGASVRMRMWNPDGSEDMCGNGLRCIVRLAHGRGHVSGDITVQTLAGLRRAHVEAEGIVRVSMGTPNFALEHIPMRVPLDVSSQINERAVEYVLPVGDLLIPHVSSLSTGSTHTVIFLDAPLDDATFLDRSPQIEHHAWFPERTSIMWAHVVKRNTLRLRIWERGAGETLACGTGACAAAVAARITGRCGEDVVVGSRGGRLRIRWQDGGEIEMSGPARIVYEGRCGF